MKIPEAVQIKSKLYQVQTPKECGDRRGYVDFKEGVIVIAKRSTIGSIKYTKAERTETLVHELTHAILKEMRHKQYADEKFVTSFAKHMADALRQCGASL